MIPTLKKFSVLIVLTLFSDTSLGAPACADPREQWPQWQKPDPRGYPPLFDFECEPAIEAFRISVQGIEMLTKTFKAEHYGISPSFEWEDTPRAYWDG